MNWPNVLGGEGRCGAVASKHSFKLVNRFIGYLVRARAKIMASLGAS